MATLLFSRQKKFALSLSRLRAGVATFYDLPGIPQIASGMQFADPCEADPYLEHLVEGADGGVTGKTPSGIYTAAHIRLHRNDLNRWRRLRAQLQIDLPLFAAMIGSLERLRSVSRGSILEELEVQIDGLKRHIEEAKNRFGIG
jgi:hypothetical protein